MNLMGWIVLVVLSALAAYAVALFLWLVGGYFAIVPVSWAPFRFGMMFLPPLALPITYVGWLVASRYCSRVAADRKRRSLQLAIAVAVSVVAMGTQPWWPQHSNIVPVIVAAVPMLIVAVMALFVDRDIETALLFATITLAAIVPVGVAGRFLSLLLAIPLQAAI